MAMKGSDFAQHHDVRRSIKQLKEDIGEKKFSDIVDGEGRQYVDIVMEGGGVLGIALLGYSYALEEVGIRFLDIGGTSAGSIGALLLAAVDTKENPKSERIALALANQDLSEFVDGDVNARRLIDSALSKAGWFRLGVNYLRARRDFVETLGFNPGTAFLNWLKKTLRASGISSAQDLQERMARSPKGMHLREAERLPPGVRKADLAIITAEVSTETKVEFPAMAPLFWSEPEKVNPALYVRASMSVPYFFRPFRVENIPQGPEAADRWQEVAGYDGPLPKEGIFIDGGIMSNFPIDVFHKRDRVPVCPTFGVKLGREDRTIQEVNEPLRLGLSMFNTARHCLDYDFIRKNPDYRYLVGYIDTGDHNWLDFHLSDEAKVDLFRRGVESAANFLRRFNWRKYKRVRGDLAKAYQNASRKIEST